MKTRMSVMLASLVVATAVAVAEMPAKSDAGKSGKTCGMCKTELVTAKVAKYGKWQAGLIDEQFYSHQCSDCRTVVQRKPASKDLEKVRVCSMCATESQSCDQLSCDVAKVEATK